MAEHLEADKTREFGKTLAVFFVAVVVVMLIARLRGRGRIRVAATRVMGEVIAGIVLGPSVFGALVPDLQAQIFPQDIIPYHRSGRQPGADLLHVPGRAWSWTSASSRGGSPRPR